MLFRPSFRLPFIVLLFCSGAFLSSAQIRDGGIDPWNMGKGDWLYSITDATNKLGNHVSSVTNETSLMQFYQSQGIRYIIIKAGTGATLFNGCYSFPQFTSNLVNIAHANGILIFGYNRSYATNVAGEVAIANYVFNRGADGFVWDAEAEWESQTIGSQGPALAWSQCSIVRSNWPNKFLGHAPFPIIYLHSTFPYKEFGFWCDAVMPQIYHFSATKGSQSAGINWTDVNWNRWQGSLFSLAPTNINGLAVYWTNAIKPIVPVNDVYGPRGSSPCEGTTAPYPDTHVLEFIDYLTADPWPQTAGGYKGVNFWRADLHGPAQWNYIKNGTSGSFTGIVNNLVIDDPNSTVVGAWTSVRTWNNTSTSATFVGNGSGTDTNSFGTNYLTRGQGTGSAYVQFTPNVAVAGNYDLYQWHPFVVNASTGVVVTINYTGGSSNVIANQTTNAGNWTLLGRFPFSTGTSGNVRITDNLPEPNAVAIADGMKLVFAGALANPLPDAPGNLGATAISTSRVDLVWLDVATNETGYIISRGAASGGPYADLPSLPANSTSFSDTGLLPGTSYFYRVRAFNSGGDSTNSNEATATTFPIPPAIQTQPQSQTVFLASTATFTVSATGSQPLSFQWRFNNAPIAAATNSSLALQAADYTNNGNYSVVVTNSGGSLTSSNALLTVLGLASCGDNSSGQITVPASASGLVAIAAGMWHSLALRNNGTVLAWGNNSSGQATPPVALNAIAIAAGGYHSLAIRANGTVAAWGDNSYGQCDVPTNLADVMGIAAGTWHSLALRTDGKIFAWGDNSWAQRDPPAGLSNVVALAAGGNHSLALRADGKVFAWGENTDSEGFYVGQSVVPAGLSNVTAIAAGNYHSIAIRSNALVCWGVNSLGECQPPSLGPVAAISGGGAHSLALMSNGTVAAWGSGWNGQCSLPTGLANVMAVAAGGYHSLVLLDDGTFHPQLYNLAQKSGRFTALLQTANRHDYTVEFKDALTAPSWTPLSTNSGNGALRPVLDPSASGPQRFYRVRQW